MQDIVGPAARAVPIYMVKRQKIVQYLLKYGAILYICSPKKSNNA